MSILFTAAGGFKQFFTDSNCLLPFLFFTSLSFIVLKINWKNNNNISELGKQEEERMGTETGAGQEKMMKVEKGEYGYVLEDVPHLTDYIPDLPVRILSFYILRSPDPVFRV